jgi:NAD+ synthetase
VVGLSGGIDSAVVATLAAAALGPGQVHGVAMPSRFSSDHSVADARALAVNLGLRFSIIPIEPMHAAFEAAMTPHFAGRAADIAEENIQARTRGVILMALSNKFGSLLLTTGNKSELAVGYCTLYGDMAGGLAVISDVPKTMIYRLATHMNERAGRALIPRSTLEKPPSAELRPNQTDQDSLPPYDVLDAILERYEVGLESPAEIAAAGFDAQTVADVVRKIQLSEYKRQQAAPGLKVTSRAFGFGRRMPIAARYPKT